MSKCGQRIFEIDNVGLAGRVRTATSGQKLAGMNWLHIYMRKPLRNADKLKPGKPMVDAMTGQRYPPPPPQMPDYGPFWK